MRVHTHTHLHKHSGNEIKNFQWQGYRSATQHLLAKYEVSSSIPDTKKAGGGGSEKKFFDFWAFVGFFGCSFVLFCFRLKR